MNERFFGTSQNGGSLLKFFPYHKILHFWNTYYALSLFFIIFQTSCFESELKTLSHAITACLMHVMTRTGRQENSNTYSHYNKTPLYLFLRLFGASSIQEGLIFKKFLKWINKKRKIWHKIDKNSQFWIFFKIIIYQNTQNTVSASMQP